MISLQLWIGLNRKKERAPLGTSGALFCVGQISHEDDRLCAIRYIYGVISGHSDGIVLGQDTIIRSEALDVFWWAFQHGNDTKVIPGVTAGTPRTTATAPTPTAALVSGVVQGVTLEPASEA